MRCFHIMNIFTVVMVLALVAAADALVPKRRTVSTSVSPGNSKGNTCTTKVVPVVVNRRTAFTQAAAATITTVMGGATLPVATAAAATATAAPNSSKKGAEAFVGTFTDPINHPGGTRTIKLLEGKSFGDYQLAEIIGGGGRGEPANYILPACVLGDRTIIIDFSPKGGPRDFVGVLDKTNGDIKFTRDGNRWPRQ